MRRRVLKSDRDCISLSILYSHHSKLHRMKRRRSLKKWDSQNSKNIVRIHFWFAFSPSWKSKLTYYQVWVISLKVMTNPAAVSASKGRPITSILVPTIWEGVRRRSYFWSKPWREENQSLAAAICTVILFGQPVASTWWLVRKPCSLQPRHRADLPSSSPRNHYDASLTSFVIKALWENA